ncbi:zinc finger protein 518B isoform X2 [Myotis myotis]|uniref:zinc finger protein 518B isoform X2 n=1 Tax=Myotis myotis TaxID=51298 RepID=UPI00174E7DCB|nr:zinc finger protein 518B isoform X2 [Myotis myotis]
MKDIGQQLFSSQVLDGHNSLTMSPRQPHANRATRPDRQEAQTALYQGSEAEAAVMTTATCVKCKTVHQIPLQDLKKGPGQSHKEDRYVCFQCSLGVASPPFPFGNSDPSATHVGNKADTIASSGNNKFKVRNFKPGKYYCDKCRFSTKDPLQYRKHTLQHEEIKFICSHCSHISYTKGEFQRHLVKHTGIFPYRCEYCDYGAIRNDYIVKHRKRVHERTGGKRQPKAVAKPEPKRTSASKQNAELFKTSDPGTTLQSKLPDQLSRFSLQTNKDRVRSITLVPESKEHQKDVVARQLRLIAVKPDQLIKCPRRNQPVIVLNHPDVDSPEVTNVMKVINKYKGNVLKVVLSERTRCQLGIRRHHVRLTYQNVEEANQIKRQMMLKMKLKKVHKNNYQVVDSLPDDSQCTFKCWFCGRLYEDQEEWMSHGQRHLIEATRDWDVLSSKGK